MRPRRLRRTLKVLWRNVRVLLREFRVFLFAFGTLLSIGTLAFRLFYHAPPLSDPLGWSEALYATFTLIFFQPELVRFEQASAGLRVLFFALPIIGLALVADGVLRLGTALFNLRERKEAWIMAIASTYRGHIVVCGLGRIGYRATKVLLHMGEEVVGIEHDAEGRFLEEVHQINVPVLLGDARQTDVLEKARVREASAIVVCTEDDLTNLSIALEARELNPGIKVVLRMFDSQLAEKVRHGFGIHTTFSTSALAAPVFAAAATRAQIDHSFYVDGVLLNVARATVGRGSKLEGRPISRVEEELDISVILYQGVDSFDMHPAPDITLHAGDCLVVFASLEALARLREMGAERCSTR
jgi:voltage-gated potassium channel